MMQLSHLESVIAVQQKKRGNFNSGWEIVSLLAHLNR
jgi:hypothetical protein